MLVVPTTATAKGIYADSDGDELSDWDERHLYNTDPFAVDTDGGGVWDGTEVSRGTDPLNPIDDDSTPPNQDNWAILVAPVKHWGFPPTDWIFKDEISQMRSYLLEHGWTDDHICFLTRGNESYVDGDATYENLKMALEDIAIKSDSSDLVYIFLNDHGDRTPGNHSYFCTIGNYWRDDLFAAELNKIQYKQMVVEVSCCYSGGFLNYCKGENRLILCSCLPGQVAWEGNYNLFRGLTEAPTNYLVDDGYVSVEEAHAYERDNIVKKEGLLEILPLIINQLLDFIENIRMSPDVWSGDGLSTQDYDLLNYMRLKSSLTIYSNNCTASIGGGEYPSENEGPLGKKPSKWQIPISNDQIIGETYLW